MKQEEYERVSIPVVGESYRTSKWEPLIRALIAAEGSALRISNSSFVGTGTINHRLLALGFKVHQNKQADGSFVVWVVKVERGKG